MDNDNILLPKEISDHRVEEFHFEKLDTNENYVQLLKEKNRQRQEQLARISGTLIGTKGAVAPDSYKSTDSINAEEQTNNVAPNTSNVPNNKGATNTGGVHQNIDVNKMADLQNAMLSKIEQLGSQLSHIKDGFAGASPNEGGHQNSAEELQKAYQDGFQAGKAESNEEGKNANTEIQERFSQSISLVSDYVSKANNTIVSLENELVRASIDIAAEVIQTQVEENSKQIALSLAKSLLENIKDASQVTLKVSIYDYDFLKSHITDDKITVEKDLAIAKGGVIIMSEVMNLDGTIKERFAKIKSAFYEAN